MRAVGYQRPSPISEDESLVDVDLPEPRGGGRDLLVEVRAVSVNPVDFKVRRSTPPSGADWKVLGWDAAGVVREVGSEVSLFRPGDEVFYAGAIGRPGANAELHLVDERLVGRKPKSLDWATAAALPLTSITAWEALFDRLEVRRDRAGAAAILILGAGGGVGSIAVQLARQLTNLQVIATASRPETRAWAEELGAHRVVDHSRDLVAEFREQSIEAPAYVFSTTHTEQHFDAIAEIVAPQGRIVFIDELQQFDFMKLKRKSVSLHHELMFTRSIFETADMAEQGRLLDEVSRLVDAGVLRTTVAAHAGAITAANLKRAHRQLESGTTRGKIVLEGFGP